MGLIEALVFLLILFLIVGVVIALVPLDQKIKTVVYIIIGVIAILVLTAALFGFPPMPPLRPHG